MHRSTIYILLLAVCIIHESIGTDDETSVLTSDEHVPTDTCEEHCEDICEDCEEPTECDDSQTNCGTTEQEQTGMRQYCTPHDVCIPGNCACKYIQY